jgi:hypothetical protein
MAMARLPPEHPVTVLRDRKWTGERPEIRVGTVIASPRNSDVFGNYGVPFLLELLAENLLQCLEADAHHAETSAKRKRVPGHLVPADVSQLGDRKRAEPNALGRDSWFDRVSVIYTGSACAEQSEVATDGVLIERDQQIKAIPHVGDLLRTGADRKKSVATPNDRWQAL